MRKSDHTCKIVPHEQVVENYGQSFCRWNIKLGRTIADIIRGRTYYLPHTHLLSAIHFKVLQTEQNFKIFWQTYRG